MAPQWSAVEMRALLLAWREDVDTPATQLLVHQQTSMCHTSRSLYQRFVALCGGHTLRSEVSVLARRDTLRSMWTFVTAFNSEQQQLQQQSWFALAEWEKRMAFAKAQVSSYSLLDISRDTFQEVEQIMASRRRQQERERKRVASAIQLTDIEESQQPSSAAVRVDGMDEVAVDPTHRANQPNDSVPSQVQLPAEDSGSSTESDDDFIIVDEPLAAQEDFPVVPELCTPTQVDQPSAGAASRQVFEPRNAARPPSDNGWRPIITNRNKRLKPTAVSPKALSPVRLWSAKTHEATKSMEPISAVKYGGDLNTWLEKEKVMSPLSRKTTANPIPSPSREASTMSPSLPQMSTTNIGDRASPSKMPATNIGGCTVASPTVAHDSSDPGKPPTATELEARYMSDLNTWLEKEQLAKAPNGKSATNYIVAPLREGRNPSPRSRASTLNGGSLLSVLYKNPPKYPAEDKADFKRAPAVKLQPMSPGSDRGLTTDIADRLENQATHLQSVFTAFQAMIQADAALTNQFLEEVQRDMADRELVREQVRELEESIKSELDEWAAERVRLKQKWEERHLGIEEQSEAECE